MAGKKGIAGRRKRTERKNLGDILSSFRQRTERKRHKKPVRGGGVRSKGRKKKRGHEKAKTVERKRFRNKQAKGASSTWGRSKQREKGKRRRNTGGKKKL